MKIDIINFINENKENAYFFFDNANNPAFIEKLIKYNNGIYFQFPYLFNEKDDYNLGITPALYLLRSIKKNIEEKNIIYVLEIIKNVSNKIKLLNKKKVDEDVYRILYSFSEILSVIDIKYIDSEIIDCLKIWMGLPGDSAIQSITIKILDKLINVNNDKAKDLLLAIFDSNIIKMKDNNNSNRYLSTENYYLKEFLNKKENMERIYAMSDDSFFEVLCDKLLQVIDVNDEVVYDKKDMNISMKKNNNNINLLISKNNNNIANLEIPQFYYSVAEYEKKSLYKKLHKDLENIDDNTLKEIVYYYYTFWSDFSYIHYDSLFKDTREDINDIMIYFVKEMFLIKAQKNSTKKFNEFFNKIREKYKEDIFLRILIYCYGKEFNKYRKYFFDILEKDKCFLLNRHSFEAEVYLSLKNNAKYFNSDEIKKIENILEQKPYDMYLDLYNSNNDLKSILETWQKKWYSALTDIEEFNKKYNNNKQNKEFLNFRDSGPNFIEFKSPLTEEKIRYYFSKNNLDDFCNFLNAFEKESNEEKFRGSFNDIPSKRGLKNALEETAKVSPKIFVDRLHLIRILNIEYITSILYGLEQGIKDAFTFNDEDWGKIFLFISEYLIKDIHLEDEEKNITNQKEWLLRIFIQLLEKNYKSNAKNINECKNILVLIFNYLMKENIVYESHQYTNIYDTIFGELSVVILNFSLHVNKENKNIRKKDLWNIDLKNAFKELLKLNIKETYYLLGFAFRNFLFLDYNGTIEFVNKILDEKYEMWKIFFHGFLNVQLADFFYTDFRRHYIRAIEDQNLKNENVLNDFARSIAVFYLYYKGQKKDFRIENEYLTQALIENNRFDILLEIPRKIYFVVKNAIGSNEKIIPINKLKTKAIDYWRYFYYFYIDKKDIKDDEKLLLNSFLKLIPFFNDINRNDKDMIIYSIKLSTDNLYFFFNDLAYLYKDLLDKIKNNKDKRKLSNNICDIYLEFIKQLRIGKTYHSQEEAERIATLLKKYTPDKINEIISECFRVNRADLAQIYIKDGI